MLKKTLSLLGFTLILLILGCAQSQETISEKKTIQLLMETIH